MNTYRSRRSFLRASIAFATPIALAADPNASSVPAPATREGGGLTTYQLGPVVWVRWNNRVLIAYRAHHSQKYPYIFPVAGPVTGLSLTSETALPWPHHRSLFFGCDRVNGGNYWQEDFATGQIVSNGPKLGAVTGRSVEISDACEWRKPDAAPVMRDERVVRVTVPNELLYTIDWTIRWSALTDVTVQKTNHSLFSLRAAADITPLGGGALLNANGQSGEKATFGQASVWCDFHGKRHRHPSGPVEGIAMFDHPKNPWPQCPWFTRDYGFISPTPMNFLDEPWTLAAGKSVNMRYCVVAHAGDPRDAGLDGLHRDWLSSGA